MIFVWSVISKSINSFSWQFGKKELTNTEITVFRNGVVQKNFHFTVFFMAKGDTYGFALMTDNLEAVGIFQINIDSWETYLDI